MARLFGFSIEDSEDKNKNERVVSPVPPNNEDGVDHFVTGGFYNSYLDMEGSFRSEIDLIRRYREMALHPEVDAAIEDIVNEAIVSDTNDVPVSIELSKLNASDGIKDKIRKEFKYILDLLDFDRKSHEIFYNWYVDGRLYYNKVIDPNRPQDGIQDLRYIDSTQIRYIRTVKKPEGNKITTVNRSLQNFEDPETANFPDIDEYFIYTPNANAFGQNKGIRLTRDSIAYCNSGLVDRNKKYTLSYLQKAIKSLNQLRMIEDSLVIYRLSRAPERRIFYIDVGNLPKVKAEQYLREVMNRYRNKLVYDASTGEIRDDKKFMSMLEDFWLPRREGGRGTEISTLPGGQNLGELTDVEYFQKKLYRSLNVPESRIAADGGFNLGRSSEILRDELKFSKFVGRLRKRFSHMFSDMLKTQLLLKNIVTPEDWEKMSEHIQYDFLYDNHFAELKEAELLTERLNLVATAEPYVGKYYSQDYIRRHVLRQTDEEILEQDIIIEKEIEMGIIPDPNAPVDAEGNPIDDLGEPIVEPDLESEGNSTEAPELPKGGEI